MGHNPIIHSKTQAGTTQYGKPATAKVAPAGGVLGLTSTSNSDDNTTAAIICTEQFLALTQNWQFRVAVLALATLVITFAVWGSVPGSALAGWVAFNFVAAGVLSFWGRRRQQGKPIPVTKNTILAANIAYTALGAAWGGLALATVFSGNAAVGDKEILLAFLLCGLAAGVAGTIEPLRGGATGFTFAAIMPLAVFFAASGGPTQPILAAMLVVYLFVVLLFVRSSHASFVGGIQARLHSARLLAELTNAHARLSDAIDQSPAGIALFDPYERLVTSNRMFLDFFFPDSPNGMPPGTPLETLLDRMSLAQQDGSGDDGSCKAVLERHRNLERSSEAQLEDGRWIQTQSAHTSDGGSMIVATDISDRMDRDKALAESAQLLEGTLENMDHGFVAVGPDVRIIAVNKRAQELLDTPADLLHPGADFENVVRHAAERGDYGPGDPADHVSRLMTNFAAPVPRRLERVLPDGRTLEIRHQPMPGGGHVITYTEMTEQKQVEQALRERTAIVQLLQIVAVAANEAPTVDAVMQTCLDHVCEFSGWPIGHAYLVEERDDGRELLVPSGVWHLETPARFETFRDITDNTRFVSGAGLPGRVLESGKPAWITDVTADNNFPRSGQARDVGVRSGFAFPVRVRGEVAAVVEFFTDTLTPPDHSLLDIMSHIGDQIGQVIDRKRIEDERRDSEARYRRVVELSQEAIVVVRNERIIFINPAGITLIGGRTADDILGMHILEIIHPDFRDLSKERIQKMLRDGKPAPTVHQKYVRLDGAIVDVEVTSTPFEHPEGQSIQVVARDISERLRAEEALRESEERFRAVVNNSPTKIHIKDLDGRYIMINRQAEKLFGVTDEEGRGKTTADIFPEHLSTQYVAHDRTVVETGENVEAEEEFTLEDGVHTFLTVKFPIKDTKGEITAVGAIGTDITDRKRIDEALAESQKILDSVVNAVPAVINVKGRDGRYVFRNEYERSVLDLQPGDEVGRTPEEVLGSEYGKIVRDLDRQVIESGEALPLKELEVFGSDDDKRHWLTTKVPLFDAHNEVSHVVTVSLDITKRKQDEEALREAKEEAEIASRSKSDFLANMSHELRTPLNAVIGFSEILSNELMGPIGLPAYLEYAKDIHYSGSHLLSLINDILDLSKVEAGKFELQEEEMNLGDAVEAAIRIVHERAETGEIELDVHIAKDLPPLFADERAVKQVLLNLLSNAVKFTSPGGRVSIRAGLGSDGQIYLSVEDTGIGIKEEDMGRVLTPFGQVDGALTRKHAGTGLGLPLVKSLTELHDGTLQLCSEPGVGTTATITFPAERCRVSARGQSA